MALQEFDGMFVEADDVIEAVLYVFPVLFPVRNTNKKFWKFRLFVQCYEAYHTGFDKKRLMWVRKDYQRYVETSELPFYVMRFGCGLIKKAYEQEFVELFREKHFGRRMENETGSQKEGRVLQRKVSEHRRGDGLSIGTFASAK